MEGFVGIHLGAGKHSEKLEGKYKSLCRKACRRAVTLLEQDVCALLVVDEVTRILENSPLTNAGYGSVLTWDGLVECDASIMDGKSLDWGAVGATRNVKHPITLARILCQKQRTVLPFGRIPPCVLVGDGATEYAKQSGIDVVSDEALISAKSLKKHQKYKRSIQESQEATGVRYSALDTVGVVCLDRSGSTAAGASSGGIALKHCGRVGQAAAYGCGTWAQNGSPYSVAVSTTGCGEYLMKTMLAREIFNEAVGSDLAISALHTSLISKFLESPFLKHIEEKNGGAIMMRVTEDGCGEFVWGHTTETLCVGYMSTSDVRPHSHVSRLPQWSEPGRAAVVEGSTFNAKKRTQSALDQQEP